MRKFVQVINGTVVDAAALKGLVDRWYSELGPGAVGWLGSTAGVTAGGGAVVVARFDSAEAAQRNSDRPEQGAWWSEAEKCFEGEPTFGDYEDVILVRGGGSDAAGFVQVILGRISDPGRERELTREFESATGDFRPDLLGGVVGVNEDGTLAQAFYFTSEAEAREGEKQDMPEDLRGSFEEEMALTADVRYLDLIDPWFYSPRESLAEPDPRIATRWTAVRIASRCPDLGRRASPDEADRAPPGVALVV